MNNGHHPLLLIILDGLGICNDPNIINPLRHAHLETFPHLLKTYPTISLKAAGEAVGALKGDQGNSEIGHNAIGSGQIIKQGVANIKEAFDSGAIWQDDDWKEAVAIAKAGNTLHFLGLFSDGNVHANIHDLFKMMEEAHREGIQKIRVHALLDGRDVPPSSAEKYIKMFNDFIQSLGDPDYKIASGGGRMTTTMDRYQNDWGMVERGWEAHVLGTARPFHSIEEAIKTLREEDDQARGQDQYLGNFTIVDKNGSALGPISDEDAVIFYNFRADRAIEFAQAATYEDFSHFDRGRIPRFFFAGLTEYDTDFHVPAHQLVRPIKITNPLMETLAEHNISSYAVTETVKFGHLTYYFNGNSYEPYNGEVWEEIKSDTVPVGTRPWMKSAEIADKVLDNLSKYQFLRVNFTNPDMVGHFGELEPAIVALEAIDLSLARIVKEVQDLGGTILLTADHGNIEELSGPFETSHTTNPVFFTLIDFSGRNYNLKKGDFGLANIAATIADLLDIPENPIWGSSLLERG